MGVHMAMGGWKKDSSPSGLHPSKHVESQAAMSETPRPLFCYQCFEKNDRTCYKPKGHTGKHAGMKAVVREHILGRPPKEPEQKDSSRQPADERK